ncbi:MAG: DMT family transporter [Pseudomonadota bacterium]
MSLNGKSASHIPLPGIMLLVLLSFLWGANMVTIKVGNQGIPPMLAAAVRSVIAAALLYLYARSIRVPVFLPSGYVKHGVMIGVLFGVEFLFLYWGTSFTDVSRAIIFLYTQPLWTAVLAHFILVDDRLHLGKSVGVLLSFVGLSLVFGSRSMTLGPDAWVGDVMEVAAGFLWAATTIYIKRFIWNTPITHYQTLFAQLLFSIPVLAAGSAAFEWGRTVSPTPIVLAALFYQSVIVAFISYLAWFWLIHRYQASRISAFTFLSPLFGVVLGGLLLGEALTPILWVGLTLVAGGIYLVNRPRSL